MINLLCHALVHGVLLAAPKRARHESSYGRSGNLTIVSVPRRGQLLSTGAASDSQGVEFETERSGLGLAASAVLGNRYLPRDRGFTFGVAFTPLIRAGAFLPRGGASAGYVF